MKGKKEENLKGCDSEDIILAISMHYAWNKSNGSYVIKDFGALPTIFSTSKYGI